MASPRRSASDNSDYEEADEDGLGLISAADVTCLRQQLDEKYKAANAYLLSSKEPVEKRRLIDSTIQDLLFAFNRMAAAYDRLTTYHHGVNSVKSVLKKTIREEVSKLLPPASQLDPRSSYAEAASRTSKADAHRVKIANGPTVVVPSAVSFVIGPKTSSAGDFNSPDDTRKAVMKAVRPGDVNLRVSKVLNSRNNSVRIIADHADIDRIRSSSTLAAAGLEVKVRDKLNPRLVIRGVPVNLSSEDLLKEICAANADAGCTHNNTKIVYRYPPRESKTASSVVVETSSDVRRRLLTQGRVYLSWQSCRVEDHLRVLQCYRCQDFGHLAKNCDRDFVCGHCSESHNTSACPKAKSTPVCRNCSTAKHGSTDHRAFDASKCPLIKMKLTEKAKNISY